MIARLLKHEEEMQACGAKRTAELCRSAREEIQSLRNRVNDQTIRYLDLKLK